MDNQPKYKPQAANPLFADGRAMRPPVAGHGGARRAARRRRAVYRGKARTAQWVDGVPAAGRPTRCCSAARSASTSTARRATASPGNGDGIVAKRAERAAGGDLDAALVAARPTWSGAARSGSSSTRSPTASATCRRTAPQIPVRGPLGDRRLRAGAAAQPERAASPTCRPSCGRNCARSEGRCSTPRHRHGERGTSARSATRGWCGSAAALGRRGRGRQRRARRRSAAAACARFFFAYLLELRLPPDARAWARCSS